MHVFWDVDNKPGDGLPPLELVSRVRAAAEQFGQVSAPGVCWRVKVAPCLHHNNVKLVLLLALQVATKVPKVRMKFIFLLALQVVEVNAYANAATLARVPSYERQRRSGLKARCARLACGSCPCRVGKRGLRH